MDATPSIRNIKSRSSLLILFFHHQSCTTSIPKYKYLLTFADHIWPFVLFKKFMKILFILLWYVLSSYIFEVYLNCFYFFNFLNKINSQIWSAKVNKYLYFETEIVHALPCSYLHAPSALHASAVPVCLHAPSALCMHLPAPSAMRLGSCHGRPAGEQNFLW